MLKVSIQAFFCVVESYVQQPVADLVCISSGAVFGPFEFLFCWKHFAEDSWESPK